MKIKRIIFIKVHLYISGIIIILLSLYTLTGSLHLLGDFESETSKIVYEQTGIHKNSKSELESYFRTKLNELSPGYRFDYMKGSNERMMTRPTSRDYYTLSYNKQNEDIVIELKSPNLVKKLMEFHKGHGPKLSRSVLGVMGFFIFFSVISGLWLGLSLKAYRKTTVLTTLSGLILFAILFLL